MKYSLKDGIHRAKTKLAIAGAGIAAVTCSAVVALSGAAASAITGGTLFGSATQQSDGVHLVSDSTHPYSGINFTVPSGTTVSGITDLDATLSAVTGTCGGGSPRFSVETASGNIFVYIGTAPNFTTCSNGSTGNLLTTSDLRVDTSQLAGGTFYDTWAHAVSLVGSSPVTGLSLVVDGGWLAPQEFVVTESSLNNQVISYIPTKDSCKNGGWQSLTDTNGHSFKNQGDCVSFFATSGRNLAATTH